MKRFKNILLVTDFRPGSKNAFARAVSLAEKNRAKLTVVDVIDELPGVFQKVFAKSKKDSLEKGLAKQKLQHLREAVKPLEGKISRVNVKVLKGRGFVEVIRQVKKAKHDLVIIPSEGKTKFQQHIFGSLSMHLMRKCPCPVWVVKSARKRKYFRILAAVKLNEWESGVNPLNLKMMELATSLARWDNCKLDVMFTWYLHGESFLRELNPEERKKLHKETQREYELKMDMLVDKFKKAGHKFKVHVKEGEAYQAIPEQVRAGHVDLIIMGTLSRTGISGLLIGNTAEGVLQQVDCSVLTVKPEGFQTPIK